MTTITTTLRVCLLCLMVSLAGTVLAAPAPLPAYAPFPPGMAQPDKDQWSYEPYGEAEFFPDAASSDATLTRGKHWHANLVLTDVPADTENRAIWARLKDTWLKAGWTVAAEYDSNPPSATLRLTKGGLDAWITVSVFGAGDIRMDLVETGGPPFIHKLTPPAATPERLTIGKGDFPYLAALPGAKFESDGADSGPMEVTLPDAEQPEIVATGSIVKHYIGPEGLSTLQFVTAWREALTNAGWTIVSSSQGPHQSDATITAHFTGNGRNIWTYMHSNFGEYSVRVGDAGGRDLAAVLNKDCHVALDGVLFDFNKATLKPDSDPVLDRVRALLTKDTALKVEVQGHTDSVGGNSYNLNLSEARARAVAAWLTGHGIGTDRLTAKGYGKTQPVAGNDSDLGRARNRRVEVARPGCKPK